ncbi:MAG: sodium:solute symporter family protein [Planctomycetota bacterium]
MTWIDWLIVGAYVAVAAVIGIVFSKKASHSTADFFVAGRSLPWWIAGTSLVATTFSTDTPLFVAGLSRNEGIHGNWFWWSAAIGQTATIFFFAKYWRRSEALTEIEFVAQRYKPGPERDALRVFKVLFDGVLFNCVVMASVTLAATLVIRVVLDLSEEPLFAVAGVTVSESQAVLIVLAFVALAYSAASGLYGVAYTDLVQFVLAMVGTIWLAVVAYTSLESGTLAENLNGVPGFDERLLGLFPDLTSWDILTFTLLVYVMMNWWAIAPGTGYFVQRILATKSEKDSVLAFLWFNFCHYVLRPWPWIIVGLVSMVHFPDLQGSEAEQAFPLMIDKFLGPGIKGIMVAAMLAAFMSTIDTHLNWGASYLVNDLYQPFIKKDGDAKHYVLASRVSMVVLMIAAVIVTTMLTGILDAYKYLGVIVGGIGSVLILRWYWWRVNAWSEITAVLTALIVGNACELWLTNPVGPDGKETDWFAIRLLITVAVTLVAWVGVTLATSKTPDAQTRQFFERIRVPGPGWRRVSRESGVAALPGEFGRSLLGWFASMALIFGMLMGIGYALLERWPATGVSIVVAVVGGVLLARLLRGSVLFGTAEDVPESTRARDQTN